MVVGVSRVHSIKAGHDDGSEATEQWAVQKSLHRSLPPRRLLRDHSALRAAP